MAQRNRKIFTSNKTPDTTILVEFGSNATAKQEEANLN